MTFTSIFPCNSRIVIFLFFYLVNLSFGFIKNDFNKSFIISQNFPSDDCPNNFGTCHVTSLCANKYSRNSPEMDLLISSINNPSWIHGPLYSNRPYTEHQIHKLMESLLKRKIHINDLKRVFYRPVIREEDYYDTEHIFVPPFRPDPHTSTPVDPLGKRGYLRDPFDKPYFAKDPFAKLRTTPKSRDGLEIVGRDIPFIKDGKVCIEKQKYSLEDVLAQTLVSALLEAEEITKFKSKIVKVPTQHPRVLRDSDHSKLVRGDSDHSKLVRGDSDDSKLVRGDSDDSKLVREILNDIVVFNKGAPFYIPNVDKEKFETAPGYDYQSFDRKLARNMTLLQELENNTNFSTLFKDILNLQEDKSMDLWTQYLSNPLLSYLYKYSNEDKISKLPPDEVMADDLYMSIHLYKHKYLKSLAIKRQYELLNQYIKFNLKRKSTLKVMPYWIWREYWYDRENFYNSNLYDVLREIVITDPRIDLGKVTEGIFDYTNPVKRLNTFNVLSRPSINNINKYINYAIDKYGQISPKIDQIKHLINSYSKDKLEPIDPFYNTNTINMNDIIDKLVQDYTKTDVVSTPESLDKPGSVLEEVSNEPVLSPDPVKESVKLDKNLLGYEFRNILSNKNFEEAYKKHNMKYFGTPDYSIKLGQLVKGKVFKVLKDKVIVDIHAHTLAELSLRNFFHSPAEVPMGGFTTLFKAGDELIFEIIELYDHKIEVSLKKIRQFHKYRKILENKHNVFLAKVLQRYQNGILVQYTENTSNTSDTENTSATTDTAESGNTIGTSESVNTTDKSATENVTVDVSNTGFVKLKDLLDKYKNKRDVVDMNLVGQVIPVTFSEFFHVHNVPSLSNKDALKKLQVIYLREDDIIKGLVIKSTPYYLILKFGNLRGYLYVNDMNSETYKQHLITTPRNIIAQVKYINYRDGYVMLSNNDVYELSEDKLMRTNEFLAEFNKYSLEQNLEHYRKFMANYTHHKPTTTYTDTEQLVEWYLY